ncbi:hypothetical protein P43SY_005854 [Pythium insidiosum]|uniref:Acyltransferase n=1 Tax=Pythium insidiosum TaxID=114742 RepID=A0AAD5QF07_PYTIN|nr:hypothetical protein P43SY_005854 [Pythium insidiosum]
MAADAPPRCEPAMAEEAACSAPPCGSVSTQAPPASSFCRRLHLPGFGVIFFAVFVALVTSINLILVLYVPYGVLIEALALLWAIKLDRTAFNGRGRPITAFRRAWWWDSFRDYFPLSLRQEDDFDPKKRYLFVIHPHGIIGFGAWLTFAADAAGLSRKNRDLDVALATVNVNFFLPFWREILFAVGILDASFKSLQAGLRRNRSIAVVLGGAAEALHAHPGTCDIILNKRKGIIRLALNTGTPLVPVFMFGENELFYQVPNPKGSLLYALQKQFLKYCKFSPPIPVGTGVLGCPVGLLPHRVPLQVVTGTPIPVPHIESPTDADVLKYQAIYRSALEKLYAKYAPHYYEHVLPPEMRPATPPKLRIVE